MTKKKLNIDLNNFPIWAEINWISFEIDNAIGALRKSIEINQHSFNLVCIDLDKKISSIKNDNKNFNNKELHDYIEHLHGAEERIIIELSEVQKSSTVMYAFAIFENKLKMISDRIKRDFEFDYPEENVKSYAADYWKVLRIFLEENITKVEKYYTQLKNQIDLRHIIVHQNNIIKNKQVKVLKQIKNIQIHENEGIYYLTNIENEYLEQLVVLLTLFFETLIETLTIQTNEKLKNVS